MGNITIQSIFIILAYIFVGFVDLIPLYKTKAKKEGLVYSIMTLFAVIVLILFEMGVKIYSPADFIERVVHLFIQI